MELARPLPWEPEALPKARQRYTDALIPLYRAEEIRHTPKYFPGSDRKHVFDLQVGIRMIVTREIAPLATDPEKRGPYLHIGAKIMPGRWKSNGKQIPVGEVIRAFLYMSRSPSSIQPLWSDYTENGVLHIIFPPPLRGEYADNVPYEVAKRHEDHIVELTQIMTTIEDYDPRIHCSLCKTD